ncbi:hypothetical protein D047_3212B, partial [Vibrio parahaemolyticus VPTS-2010_2]
NGLAPSIAPLSNSASSIAQYSCPSPQKLIC